MSPDPHPPTPPVAEAPACPDAPCPDASCPDAPCPDAPCPDAPCPKNACPDTAYPETAHPETDTPKKKRRSQKKRNRKQKMRALRERFMREQNYRCPYCGCVMVTEPYLPHSATLDHVVPRARGGTNISGNLVAACMRCNSTRHHRLADPVSHALALEAMAEDKARRPSEVRPKKNPPG